MRAKISVGRRTEENKNRSVCDWVGTIDLRADNPDDAVLMAAVYRAIFTPFEGDTKAKEINAALHELASDLKARHKADNPHKSD